MKRWYAVYTKPRNEELATQHLVRQGFEIVYPRYLKRRSHARVVSSVSAPLFPRYLFASFEIAAPSWSAIRSTRGVIDLVRNGVSPAPVPDEIIGEIRRRADDNGHVVLGKQLHLERGDSFCIDTGPFAAHVAIFEERRDNDRVIALLSLLGRKVTVQMPIDAVVPVM